MYEVLRHVHPAHGIACSVSDSQRWDRAPPTEDEVTEKSTPSFSSLLDLPESLLPNPSLPLLSFSLSLSCPSFLVTFLSVFLRFTTHEIHTPPTEFATDIAHLHPATHGTLLRSRVPPVKVRGLHGHGESNLVPVFLCTVRDPTRVARMSKRAAWRGPCACDDRSGRAGRGRQGALVKRGVRRGADARLYKASGDDGAGCGKCRPSSASRSSRRLRVEALKADARLRARIQLYLSPACSRFSMPRPYSADGSSLGTKCGQVGRLSDAQQAGGRGGVGSESAELFHVSLPVRLYHSLLVIPPPSSLPSCATCRPLPFPSRHTPSLFPPLLRYLFPSANPRTVRLARSKMQSAGGVVDVHRVGGKLRMTHVWFARFRRLGNIPTLRCCELRERSGIAGRSLCSEMSSHARFGASLSPVRQAGQSQNALRSTCMSCEKAACSEPTLSGQVTRYRPAVHLPPGHVKINGRSINRIHVKKTFVSLLRQHVDADMLRVWVTVTCPGLCPCVMLHEEGRVPICSRMASQLRVEGKSQDVWNPMVCL
ncbi:hypothetical protein FB451DRAFT_1168289 [Mycena latifolia]|nr:hypothetical protein FB451DRAFT_1168289 [Mycena latifolia]